MERLLLLDGNGLIYRGYFALIEQPLTTSKGELVTAVFGFTNIVLRAIQDVKPDRVAIAFDLPGAHVPPRPLRRVQGDPDPHARRHARADPQGEAGRARPEHPRVRAGGVRGGRRHRHARRPGRGPRVRHHDPHRRPRHAPARQRAHEADGLAPRRHREHRRLRPREDRGAVGPAARADARLQVAQGRPDRQHPGHPGGGREDGVEADRDLGHARRAVRAHRRGHARRSCAPRSRSTASPCSRAAS